ncbi:ABC transporter permease [Phyllobacterium sp. 0TCS1.6C]|nr:MULTISPECIES: ABC transporter permease [unclassified Phyllobacterium]MCX8279342.1 ABC transporter permease [Phyllobacterium sp. 0TCS1.6C]MCX8292467.1 ABC transporter permease [Phyllobacterium sp. 0TCS1.6A]
MTHASDERLHMPDLVGRLKSVLKHTKLYWGLGLLFLVGVLSSPVSSKGNNIFLSFGNLSDVFRQVSVTGITAVGMTLVILIAGIDLSVGSVLALGSVVCAMLLTNEGWSAAYSLGVPAVFLLSFLVISSIAAFAVKAMRASQDSSAAVSSGMSRPALALALVAAAAIAAWVFAGSGTKAGVLLVLLVVPAVGFMLGAINGLVIVGGRLQPFIVTLAMMVAGLGVARLTAGQNTAVWPVYTGSNATENFEVLRSLIFGIVPVPGVIFAAIVLLFWAVLTFTKFGRYIYAIGGNEEAARLAGVPVWRVKITVYAISGYLAALAGILYVAQYRQGKPDAGMGLELDAIAAVVIGGTSLMGGRGSMIGTLVGVLIFGFLSNILQLNNIDSNTQLVLKGMIIIAAVLLQERRSSGWAFFLSQLRARSASKHKK